MRDGCLQPRFFSWRLREPLSMISDLVVPMSGNAEREYVPAKLLLCTGCAGTGREHSH